MPKILRKSCPDKCGNVTIPFPFGIRKHCYLDGNFRVECHNSSNSTYLAVFDGLEYSEISVQDSYVTLITQTPPVCYSKNGSSSDGGYGYYLLDSPFTLSSHRNKFVAIGCDIYASIEGESDDAVPPATGCASFCDNLTKSNISAGRGYCEIPLPRTIHSFDIGVYSVNTEKRAWTKNGSCNLAFIVDKKLSKYDSQIDWISRYGNWTNEKFSIPLVLDWGIGNVSCREARKSKNYLCSQNAGCRDVDAAGGGYNCYCKQGYQGNPYVSDGCKDVDECKDLTNNKCKSNATCINTPGSYYCTCPSGYYYSSYNLTEDGWRCIPGQGHHSSSTFLLLGVGIVIGVLVLIAFGFWLYWHLKRQKKIRIKQKFFKRNGGLLFQQQISSSEGSVMKTKLFAAEELEKATDNFNQSRVLGKGGVGTVYKDPLVVEEGVKEDILVVAKLAKRCIKLNAKKRPSMREVAADLDRLTGKQIQPSHELICRDNYLSESECSYSCATDGINED
ncbi:hypothetical protein Vadar_032166 [Vaccinium darrowii]|uniref:Uncharacterized protein n=1 Tax=Vaccinium darrowii TaxID=229202 RepID=A0ACB7YAL9_9ERIC|nr:hypothetical protein Vadar_032166 [Vaccinium darrowii]